METKKKVASRDPLWFWLRFFAYRTGHPHSHTVVECQCLGLNSHHQHHHYLFLLLELYICVWKRVKYCDNNNTVPEMNPCMNNPYHITITILIPSFLHGGAIMLVMDVLEELLEDLQQHFPVSSASIPLQAGPGCRSSVCHYYASLIPLIWREEKRREEGKGNPPDPPTWTEYYYDYYSSTHTFHTENNVVWGVVLYVIVMLLLISFSFFLS